MSFNENDSGEHCDRWNENDEAILNLVLQWSLEDSRQAGTADHCALEEYGRAEASQHEPQEDTLGDGISSNYHELSTNETEYEHTVGLHHAPEAMSSILINNDSQTSEPVPTLCSYHPDNGEQSGVWNENAEALTSMVLQWSLEDSMQQPDQGTGDHRIEECEQAQPSEQESQEETPCEGINSNFEHSTNNTEDEHTVDRAPEKMSSTMRSNNSQINESAGPTRLFNSYQSESESKFNEDNELMLRAGSDLQIYDENNEWFKVAIAMSLQETSLSCRTSLLESASNPDSTSQLSDQCVVSSESLKPQDLNSIASDKNKIFHDTATSQNVHFTETDHTHKSSHDSSQASAAVIKEHKYQSVIDATVPELENLKTLLNCYYDHPCKLCRRESKKVEVGSWACGDCNIVWGYDDLNGITDFVKDLIKLEPCRNCGNDDPYKIGLIMLDEKPIYGCNVCNHEMRPPRNPYHPPQNVHSKQYGSELASYGSYDELRNNGAVDVYSGFQNNFNDQEMVQGAAKINGFAEAKEEFDKLKPALMASTGRCIKDLQRTLARNNNTSNLKTQLSSVGRREAAMLLPQIGQNLGAAAGWLLFKNSVAANIGGTVGGIIGEVISGLISRR